MSTNLFIFFFVCFLFSLDLKHEIDVKQRVTSKPTDTPGDRVDGTRMSDSGYDGAQQLAATPTTPTTPTANRGSSLYAFINRKMFLHGFV